MADEIQSMESLLQTVKQINQSSSMFLEVSQLVNMNGAGAGNVAAGTGNQRILTHTYNKNDQNQTNYNMDTNADGTQQADLSTTIHPFDHTQQQQQQEELDEGREHVRAEGGIQSTQVTSDAYATSNNGKQLNGNVPSSAFVYDGTALATTNLDTDKLSISNDNHKRKSLSQDTGMAELAALHQYNTTVKKKSSKKKGNGSSSGNNLPAAASAGTVTGVGRQQEKDTDLTTDLNFDGLLSQEELRNSNCNSDEDYDDGDEAGVVPSSPLSDPTGSGKWAVRRSADAESAVARKKNKVN